MTNKRKATAAQDRKTRRRIGMTLFILSILILCITLIFDSGGLTGRVKRKNTVKRLKTDIDTIKLQNEVIKSQIELIRNDPLEVERIAREELGLSKPGEVIYKFEAH